MQNAFIESFDSKLRDECLNEHLFLTLAEARETLAQTGCRPVLAVMVEPPEQGLEPPARKPRKSTGWCDRRYAPRPGCSVRFCRRQDQDLAAHLGRMHRAVEGEQPFLVKCEHVRGFPQRGEVDEHQYLES